MDLVELTKLLGGASDRVVLLLGVVWAVRYLTRKNEEQRAQLVGLYERADQRAVEMAAVVTGATAILERVEKKL